MKKYKALIIRLIPDLVLTLFLLYFIYCYTLGRMKIDVIIVFSVFLILSCILTILKHKQNKS